MTRSNRKHKIIEHYNVVSPFYRSLWGEPTRCDFGCWKSRKCHTWSPGVFPLARPARGI